MKKLTITINAKAKQNGLFLPITLYVAAEIIGDEVKTKAISVVPLDEADEPDFIYLDTAANKIDRMPSLTEVFQLETPVFEKIELRVFGMGSSFKDLPDVTEYDLSF